MLPRLLFMACLMFAAVVQAQTLTDNAAEPPAQQSPIAQPAAGTSTLAFPGKPGPSAPSTFVTNPLVVLAGLAFIVLLIYGCAWLVKRMGAVNIGGGSGMKIVAGLSVGQRERVLLLEVGERQVLVGVAPGRVSHLESFDEPVVNTADSSGGNFSERLKAVLSAGRDVKS